jgi:hypothetical protein
MNHHPLLSIVPILLTSSAWAELCANPHPCVGQTVSSGVSGCCVPCRPNDTDDKNPCRIGYCLGQEEAAIGQAVVECGRSYAGCPATSKDGDSGMDTYRWLCILTAQLHNQIEQTQQTFCPQVGGVCMSFGVLQVGCPINICLP